MKPEPTKTFAEKAGEFIGFSIMAVIFITFLAFAALAWYGIYSFFAWLAGGTT